MHLSPAALDAAIRLLKWGRDLSHPVEEKWRRRESHLTGVSDQADFANFLEKPIA
jgi:hypothetical protein